MDNANISSNVNNISMASEVSSNCNIVEKLKRFKIRENLLVKSINKCLMKDSNNDEKYYIPPLTINDLDSKSYFARIKKSYLEIKNLLEDLKNNTDSQRNLESLDLDDVKKDVLQLDEKIRLLKSFLQSQSTMMKIKEQEIMIQMRGANECDQTNACLKEIARKPKIQGMPYKDIQVPSPVKVLINSPLKCVEVQEFQEFLKNSKNQYGGWIPYNHNIFLQCWKKHIYIDNEYHENDVTASINFQTFVNDLSRKIPGIMEQDIVAHSKWYSKFVFLKQRQQKALEKWRTNKKIITNLHYKTQSNRNIENRNTILSGEHSVSHIAKKCSKINEDEIKEMNRYVSDDDNLNNLKSLNLQEMSTSVMNSLSVCEKTNVGFGFLKPTNQWNNRCNSTEVALPQNTSLETIKKRRIPDWRLILKE